MSVSSVPCNSGSAHASSLAERFPKSPFTPLFTLSYARPKKPLPPSSIPGRSASAPTARGSTESGSVGLPKLVSYPVASSGSMTGRFVTPSARLSSKLSSGASRPRVSGSNGVIPLGVSTGPLSVPSKSLSVFRDPGRFSGKAEKVALRCAIDRSHDDPQMFAGKVLSVLIGD